MARLIASCTLTFAALLAPAEQAALKPGDAAPAFKTQAAVAGKAFDFDLTAALKKGPVVLYFFPAAHTEGCNLEAHLFSEAIGDFKARGASVIGITAGNLDELAAFSKENEHCGGKFPVAADPGAVIAKEYKATLALKPGWSDRTSYVIAPDGTILKVYSNLSAKDHVKETLAALPAK